MVDRHPSGAACLAAWVGLALFLILAALCSGVSGPVLFDTPVSSWLLAPNRHDRAYRIAAVFADQRSVDAQIVGGVLLAVYALVATRRRFLALAVLVIPPVIDGLTIVAKDLIGRTRPEVQVSAEMVGSFPSGHAAGISSRMVLLALVVWVVSRRCAVRRAAVIIGVAMSLVVAVSVVVTDAHYPTEAVGGSLLGGSLATLAAAVVMGRERFDTAAPSGQVIVGSEQ